MAKVLLSALRSPWSVGFSLIGAGYGFYQLMNATQGGPKYILETDLTGKTYIVTGATSGIGKALTEALADKGARVIMATRNREKCQAVRRDIVLSTRNKQIYCRQCDMADFDSIEQFVSKLYTGKFEIDRVDGVVHNAAVMEPKRALNREGVELTLATNHMGPFLLTGLLLQKLLNQGHKSRIVFVNTNIADTEKTRLNLDNLNSELDEAKKEKWQGFQVYRTSKLVALLFAKELSERLKDSNVAVLMVDPGRTKSKLTSRMDFEKFFLSRWALKLVSFVIGRRSPVQAARPVLYAVADEKTQDMNGTFINREREPQTWSDRAEDKALREKLWLISEKWSRYNEHLAKLKEDTGRGYYANKAGGRGGSEATEGNKGGEKGFLQKWLPWG